MNIDVNPGDDFHVVLNGNVMALSLAAVDELYQSDVIDDATLIWQQGLGEWLRLDVILHQLEAQATHLAPAPPLAEDIYFVLVAPEEVKQMSLDLLSDAYRLDVIDENTLVWQPGFTEWIPLALLIGDESEIEHASIAPSLAPVSGPAWGSARVVDHPSSLLSDLVIPRAPSPVSPWFARSLAALALGVLGLTLHRNGISHALASEIGRAHEWNELDHRLGQASPATPQGIDLWLGEVSNKYALDSLSDTQNVRGQMLEVAANVPALDRSDVDHGEESKQAPAPVQNENRAATAAGSSPSLPSGEAKALPTPDPAASAFGASLKNETLPPPQSRAATPRRNTKSRSGGLPTSGSAYDPMNGKL